MPPTREAIAALSSGIDELGERLRDEMGSADAAHFYRILVLTHGFFLTGLITAFIRVNPLSILLVALARHWNWTVVAHHVLHRGLDRVSRVPSFVHSQRFARGWKRWLHWPDWFLPDSWDLEHNRLHHYRLGERQDPDVVERGFRWLRESRVPTTLKWPIIVLFALTWKFTYYAPNLIRVAVNHRRKEDVPLSSWRVWSPLDERGRTLWLQSYLPFVAVGFLLPVLVVLPLGTEAASSMLVNLILAELLTNLLGFVAIVPNHTGDDLQVFEVPARNRAEWSYRQIVGSVDYPAGTPWRDYAFGWLNYQVEHHLWPDLSPLAYRRSRDPLKALLERHDLELKVQPIWRRLGMTTQIMTGCSSMMKGPIILGDDEKALSRTIAQSCERDGTELPHVAPTLEEALAPDRDVVPPVAVDFVSTPPVDHEPSEHLT